MGRPHEFHWTDLDVAKMTGRSLASIRRDMSRTPGRRAGAKGGELPSPLESLLKYICTHCQADLREELLAYTLDPLLPEKPGRRARVRDRRPVGSRTFQAGGKICGTFTYQDIVRITDRTLLSLYQSKSRKEILPTNIESVCKRCCRHAVPSLRAELITLLRSCGPAGLKGR